MHLPNLSKNLTTVFTEKLTSSWKNNNSYINDMIQTHKLWSVPVTVVDDFVADPVLLDQLKSDPAVTQQVDALNATIKSMDINSLSPVEQQIAGLVSNMVYAHCVENNIDFDNLQFSNFVKSYVYEYNQQSVHNNSYEPHHDMVEGNYITACFYLDSSWDSGNWCGGELALYREMTFATYPSNVVNIVPKPNRLAIFPGYVPHRVKPYFGKKPRTTLVFAWSVIDAFKGEPTVI